jgi:hypothetical protein
MRKVQEMAAAVATKNELEIWRFFQESFQRTIPAIPLNVDNHPYDAQVERVAFVTNGVVLNTSAQTEESVVVSMAHTTPK